MMPWQEIILKERQSLEKRFLVAKLMEMPLIAEERNVGMVAQSVKFKPCYRGIQLPWNWYRKIVLKNQYFEVRLFIKNNETNITGFNCY